MVSVIIPNYNHAPFLKQRIDSVLNQSFQNFEVIILDDCSKDNSKEIIELYRHHSKLSQIVYNERNSGSVFKQWEKGINLAKGTYIWIAESDDYAHPKFLELMVPLLDNNEKLGFTFCNAKIILSDGTVHKESYADIRNSIFQNYKWNNDYTIDGKKEIKENLIYQCTVNNASGVLFRKSAILDVNPFDKEFKYIGDWYCYLKICHKYHLSYLNVPLNFYRDHGMNTSVSLFKDLRYVKEYFTLFDWAFRNVDFIDDLELKKIFEKHVKHSIIRKITLNKLIMYYSLFKLNPKLFFFLIKSNMPLYIKRLLNSKMERNPLVKRI